MPGATPDPAAESLYGDGARRLQDALDTRRLADAIANRTLHRELLPGDVDLIRAQSTVWIATVDAHGWPDVSYKGGEPGFVEVTSPSEIRIPSYDGNGMMRTLGNVVDTARAALLFVDTARPWRLRVHGSARVSTDPHDVARHHGAEAVLIVTVGRVFPNCGRYVHGSEISEYVPRPGHEPPLPSWKRYEEFRDALRPADRARLDPG
jgi:predicted pyridoxine 5'-phosphate oxidase superfamily flavin-nucleotide-binding protein